MSKGTEELAAYLQSVTDVLSGQPVHVRSAQQALGSTYPAAEMEATRLRKVWEMLDQLSPLEPDDAVMDELLRRVKAAAERHELDDDELDLVVGAAREPTAADLDKKDKGKS